MSSSSRKNSPLTGRKLEWNWPVGVQPSVLTGWVERERRRERGGRETQRSIITTIITTTIIIIEI